MMESDWAGWISLTLALAGCVYTLAASRFASRFAARRLSPAEPAPAVTILKPLHKLEPQLGENLESFIRQDYRGPVQIVFGVQDAADPAIPLVEALIAGHPDRDLALVVDPTEHGTNRKVSNLINIAGHARHDVIVLADSDMRVAPDYLEDVVGALAAPGVGLVSCVYHGIGSGSFWSALSADAIASHFLPNAVLGIESGLATPCFGSTIALRRETLGAIGGFEAFRDQLADDYQMGAAVRGLGLGVTFPPMTVGHVCAEQSWGELWTHEVRWARTIRTVNWSGHAGSIVTHPVPLALIGLVLAPGAPALTILGLALACRIRLLMRLEAVFGLEPHPRWRLPLRDVLSFAILIRSFLGGTIGWRGKYFSVGSDGRLVHNVRSRAP